MSEKRRDSLTRAPAPLRNAAGILLSTLVLESPTTCKEFEGKVGQAWARQIVVDYYSRTEEGWLLGPMVKILTIMCKENPSPGGLSRSYILEVFYKVGQVMTQEHWFVKIPLSLQTIAMDERELVMYNNIFPKLQVSSYLGWIASYYSYYYYYSCLLYYSCILSRPYYS